MKGSKNAVALLLAVALVFTLLPAAAEPQRGIAGTWEDSGFVGTTLIVLGGLGNYLIWSSYKPEIETGTFSLEYPDLVMTRYDDGTSARWRYNLEGDVLEIISQQEGTSLALKRTESPVPEALPGTWEGEDESGTYEVSFFENGEYEKFHYSDFSYDEGIYLGYGENIALCFSDGYGQQLRFIVVQDPKGDILELHDKQSGELLTSLRRFVPDAP